jgi:hypothetical protein
VVNALPAILAQRSNQSRTHLQLRQQLVVFGMGPTNEEPHDYVTVASADSTIGIGNSNRPER